MLAPCLKESLSKEEMASQPSPTQSTSLKLTRAIREGIENVQESPIVPRMAPRLQRLVPMFAGNYDVHSCIHAHWATMSIRRLERQLGVESDPEIEKTCSWVLERLVGSKVVGTTDSCNPFACGTNGMSQVEALEDGLDFFDEMFEVPYGLAWFALMLEETRRVMEQMMAEGKRWKRGEEDVVRRVRSKSIRMLVRYLDAMPFPEKPTPTLELEKDSNVPHQPFIGTHQSWLFAYFLTILAVDPSVDEKLDVQLNQKGTRNVRAALVDMYASRVAPVREEIRVNPVRLGRDFLYLPALLAIVERVLTRTNRFTDLGLGTAEGEKYPLDDGMRWEWPLITGLHDSHGGGFGAMRVWPYAFDGMSDLDRRKIFEERMETVMTERADLWGGGPLQGIGEGEDGNYGPMFIATGHWVPQFIWMGIWASHGFV
ncbi:hypothetical protein BJ742DRAFT_741029 [Cladochytrium replicatum]|nr:hypothetical protein BJ742DRAFT_741029 [Cladochytrium replicatum]